MFKVSSSEIVKITKALERAAFAINALERLGQNKIVFLEIKKELNDLTDELKSRYEIEKFSEWDKKEK
jgi:hypothetical protein